MLVKKKKNNNNTNEKLENIFFFLQNKTVKFVVRACVHATFENARPHSILLLCCEGHAYVLICTVGGPKWQRSIVWRRSANKVNPIRADAL